MKQSDSISSVMKALGAFQAKCIKIKKDSTNPHFKSKYASLASILDEIQPVLTECGLVFTQIPEGNEELVTMLYHAESAEFLSAGYKLNAVHVTPQGLGSAITYARRYSLTAILGLNIDDDDDGNGGSGLPPQPQQKPNSQALNNASPAHNPAPPQQQGQTPQQSTGQPAPQTPFNKSYNDAATILAVIKTANEENDFKLLYKYNKEFIDKRADLRDAITARRKAIENQGKVIITDDQFKKVCDRLRKGELAVYGNALNAYVLNQGQKEELAGLHKMLSEIESRLTIKYNQPDDVATIISFCYNEAQILKLHQNNAMIIDRTPDLITKLNARLHQIKTAA